MKTTTEKLMDVKQMRNANSSSRPIDFDWTEGFGEKWDYVAACKCDKCGQVVVGAGESIQHCELNGESDCEGYCTLAGPMMNYYYPLDMRSDFDPVEAAKGLASLPLVIVQFLDSDKYGLALSGGGMDFSWEICESFMRLETLPPVYFCDLPRMAGRPNGSVDYWIIAGCLRAVQGQLSRDRFKLKNLIALKSRK